MTPDTAKIILNEDLLIAKGGHRSCYAHPSDQTKCIKILHQSWRTIKRRVNDPLRFFRRKVNYHENLSEWRDLQKIHHKIDDTMRRHIPKAYGFVSTSLGKGLVQDLIKNEDGSSCSTLRSHIIQNGFTSSYETALGEMWDFFLEHGIIVRDPTPHNIVIKEKADGTFTTYLVDGFGRAAFLPFVEWIPSKRTAKILERKEKCYARISKDLETIARGEKLSQKGVLHHQ